MEIDNSELVPYILLGLFIWSVLLYFIIRGAVKDAGAHQRNVLIKQNRLLRLLLEKHGVDKDIIEHELTRD